LEVTRASQGTSAAYAMTFEVEVDEASPHVGLTAAGPITIGADYDVKPAEDGSRVLARVSVRVKDCAEACLRSWLTRSLEQVPWRKRLRPQSLIAQRDFDRREQPIERI
jgi:hypothetical protein